MIFHEWTDKVFGHLIALTEPECSCLNFFNEFWHLIIALGALNFRFTVSDIINGLGSQKVGT